MPLIVGFSSSVGAMTLTGHAAMQAPQNMHNSGCTTSLTNVPKILTGFDNSIYTQSFKRQALYRSDVVSWIAKSFVMSISCPKYRGSSSELRDHVS